MTLYRLPIKETLDSAWAKTYGAKSTIWIAIAIIVLIVLGLTLISTIIFSLLPQTAIPTATSVANIIGNIFVFLLSLGIIYIGIRRTQDMPISYIDVFKAFEGPILVKVLGVYLIQVMIIAIPIAIAVGICFLLGTNNFISAVLFTLAGITMAYLTVRMLLAMAFVLDKNFHPLDAIKSSFQSTHGNFWRIFFMYLLVEIIIVISAIPLGIGLIWTLPFSCIVYATLYRNLSLNNRI
jgi:hypothetical protein